MFKKRALAALSGTFGRIKSNARRFYHIKHGALAEARENVRRVHQQVADFERSCACEELDERHPTKRIVHGFFNAVRHHERALTGYSEDNVEAMDSLERVSNDLVAAASTLYAIDPALYQAKVGVSLLAGVRGLDSKEAFARYLADLKTVVEDRRERAALLKERREEGYTDVNGKKHSPAEIASKKERDDARRADPMASRLSETGHGRQDEESNNESMRSRQDWRKAEARRNPHRLRDAVDAAHKERNAPPPPPGADRRMNGYAACSRLVPPGEPNPATWDLGKIKRRVAEFRERLGVPELDPNVFGTYVCPDGDAWRVVPPVAELRKLRVKGRPNVYNPATRSCIFLAKAEAVAAYEKFMASSTSDVERKAMLYQPEEAFICVYCDHAPWKTIHARVMHEKYHCKSRPGVPESSSSEEEESEEVVAPPPKRARFWSLW